MTLSEAVKPDKFKKSTKWQGWKPTFLNYLCSIPGRDGIPLKYICREKDDEADIDVANDVFLDDYVPSAPLEGNSYAIDTVQVQSSYSTLSQATTLRRQRSKGYLELLINVKLSNV
jgi:hypothetical protein